MKAGHLENTIQRHDSILPVDRMEKKSTRKAAACLPPFPLAVHRGNTIAAVPFHFPIDRTAARLRQDHGRTTTGFDGRTPEESVLWSEPTHAFINSLPSLSQSSPGPSFADSIDVSSPCQQGDELPPGAVAADIIAWLAVNAPGSASCWGL